MTLALYPWQRRALDAWASAGRRGVVEAVTGSGKTRLALAAMAEAVEDGRKVAVIVPTRELVRQWRREIERYVRPAVGSLKVGQLGDGEWATLKTCDILVATATSAAEQFRRYAGRTKPAKVLLVADECHHYAADTWANALQEAFHRRLGLTATYEREDGGVERVLDPYFAGVCYAVGYREALDDDVIAHFRVAFAGVRFSGSEQAEYDAVSDKAAKTRRRLIKDYRVTAEPFGTFLRETQALAKGDDSRASRTAMVYLSAFTRRRALMAECQAKLDLVERLGPAVAMASRTIVFAQTVVAADAAIERIAKAGIPGATIEASMDSDERAEAFDAFERGDLAVVAAPKVLDEGVDVPTADLAIVLATSRSRRQLIQRMGRVIRKKPDGRPARIVVLYVEDTAEDPDQGAHEDFLDEVTQAADAVATFPPDRDPGEICAWLAPHPGATVPRRASARPSRHAVLPSARTGRNGAPASAPAPAVRVSAPSRKGSPPRGSAATPQSSERTPRPSRCEKCLRDGPLGSRCSCGWIIGTKAVTCPRCGALPTWDLGEPCPAGGTHDLLEPSPDEPGRLVMPRPPTTFRTCGRCASVTEVMEGPCPTCGL